ncbi:asparagine synthase C-terminal domain-containing protein [Actinomyces trachealis]|uniref:asparagine synthase-related protein n=1 Tax=Actinomyces trachealis TaxID=2763540 RepID=UPI0018C5D85D|nr:asparagine synthase C-terminal domain-containing protein [Actinomyces trachealis]
MYYTENKTDSSKAVRIWFDLKQAGSAIGQPSREYCAIFLAGLNQTFPFDTYTIWQDLLCLPPGYEAYGETHKPLRFKYKATMPQANLPLDDLAEGFACHVSERADAFSNTHSHISCNLSGGLDSSYTAAMMAQHTDHLQTVFLDNGAANIGDAQWARHVADIIKSDHKTVDYLSNSTVLRKPPGTISSRLEFGFDESFRYVTLAPNLASMSEQFGSAIHLNGHGGDELFGPNSAMAWSYYRSPLSPFPQLLRNTLGYAKANRFPVLHFMSAVRSESAFYDELTGGINPLPMDYSVHEKYDSNWIPAVTVPSFYADALSPVLNRVAQLLSSKFSEPYATDRSQHRIIEDVIAHIRLLRSLNMMNMQTRRTFASLFLSTKVVSQAMRLRIEDRFLARTIKPLLYRTWPQDLPDDVFYRTGKGEYSAATFSEFSSAKSRIRDLLSTSSSLAQMELLDSQLVTQAIQGFSADGSGLDALMRAASLESWLSER